MQMWVKSLNLGTMDFVSNGSKGRCMKQGYANVPLKNIFYKQFMALIPLHHPGDFCKV